MTITRDALLTARCKTELIEVPGWGQVRVRELTARARAMIELAITSQDAARRAEFKALFVLHGVVTDAGEPVFAAADLPRIMELPAAVVQAVFEAVNRMSGLTEAAVDEARGNS